MITDINSEDRLVQKMFADHLHDVLGSESNYAFRDETAPQKKKCFHFAVRQLRLRL